MFAITALTMGRGRVERENGERGGEREERERIERRVSLVAYGRVVGGMIG